MPQKQQIVEDMMSDYLFYCQKCNSLISDKYEEDEISCEICNSRMIPLHITEDEWNKMTDEEKRNFLDRYKTFQPQVQKRRVVPAANNSGSKTQTIAKTQSKAEVSYEGKSSPMSIAALVLSILGCTGIIGIILGIIDVSRNDGRRKGLSIAAIVVGAIMTISVFGAMSSGEKKETVATKQVVEEMVDKDEATSPILTHQPETEEENSRNFEVTMDVAASKVDDGVIFNVKTNLPDEAELMFTLSCGDYNADEIPFRAQTKATVSGGKATSNAFSNKGNPLSGDYDLSITMSLPSLQSDEVRETIGQKGENMTGPLVNEEGGYNTVNAVFLVSIGDETRITAENDYTQTIFAEEGKEDEIPEKDNEIINEEDIESLVSTAEVILKENFSDNYNISYEDKIVTINLWQEGITLGAMGVKNGTVSKDDWDFMVNSLETMSKSIYNVFKPYEVTVNVNVLNDVNKDNILVMYVNGVKFYDAVEE